MSGSRIALPANALKVCAACGLLRGTKTKGWGQITRGGQLVGWTCPVCPRAAEPIRRKGGRLYAVVGVPGPDGKRKQLTRRFAADDLDGARAWVAETREDAAEVAGWQDPRKVTVRELTTRWLAKRDAEAEAGQVRVNTVNGYRSALSSLLDLIGDRPAQDVTPDDIETALLVLATTGGKRHTPLSHRSTAYALQGLRMVCNFAVRSGWLKTSPAAVVRAPKDQHHAEDMNHGPRRWTPAQLVAFRTYVDALPLDAEPWLRAGMRLTLCGLRRSEVLGIDWANVDLKTGEIRVVSSRTKNGVGSGSTLNGTKTANSLRTVAADKIHPGTATALRELWLAQGRPASGLVIADREGAPVQPDAYSRKFKALCSAAGVPYIGSIHNTRHTLATILNEAGVPDHQAAALLGHHVQTYRRFYLVTDDTGAAAAAAVAGRIFAV